MLSAIKPHILEVLDTKNLLFFLYSSHAYRPQQASCGLHGSGRKIFFPHLQGALGLFCASEAQIAMAGDGILDRQVGALKW